MSYLYGYMLDCTNPVGCGIRLLQYKLDKKSKTYIYQIEILTQQLLEYTFARMDIVAQIITLLKASPNAQNIKPRGG